MQVQVVRGSRKNVFTFKTSLESENENKSLPQAKGRNLISRELIRNSEGNDNIHSKFHRT